MIVVAEKGTSALQITHTNVETGGDNHSIPGKFITDFKNIWKQFFTGSISDTDKTDQLDILMKDLPPQAKTRLETYDSENKTPLSRMVAEARKEFQEETERWKMEGKSKMGQGKRLPKSERIHTRREKAAEREKNINF